MPRPTVVVTTPILGAIVREIVGNAAKVTVLMPNGADPHEWQPSAKDIERLNHAALVVHNGLGLEAGLDDALHEAEEIGVELFAASDAVTNLRRGTGHDDHATGDAGSHDSEGGTDPHIWLDPVAMQDVAKALEPALAAQGITVSSAATVQALEQLDTDVANVLARIADADRELVTGHDSFGYFAARYRFRIVGVIVPGFSSQASESAAQLAQLTKQVRTERAKAIFTEIGTPPNVAKAIGEATGARVVELASHTLPGDGTYASFLLGNAKAIASALTAKASP